MAISNEEFKQAQEYEVKHIVKYKWKEEWKKLYRAHLNNFFKIGCSFPDSVVVD
ncbi:unnamed protein product, partial [marine sediment metagenome]